MRIIRNFVAFWVCCFGCGMIMAGGIFLHDGLMALAGVVIAWLGIQIAD